MKWFKHMTDAQDDEFIAELESQYRGFDGPGRWWRLLEIIGKHVDQTGKCEAIYSVSQWCQKLKVTRSGLLKFTNLVVIWGKVETKTIDTRMLIRCPKLLEIRDEYTRKSGQSPDKLQPETEAKTNLRNNKKEKSVEKPSLSMTVKQKFTNLKQLGPPASLNGNVSDIDKFLNQAQRVHTKIRGPMILNQKRDVKVAHRLVKEIPDFKRLNLLWTIFLNLNNSWLNTNPGRRCLSVFPKFLNDCQAEVNRLFKARDYRKQNSRRGNKTTPKYEPLTRDDQITWQTVLKEVESSNLPENYQTWFTPIYPLGRKGKKLIIAVPNEYFSRCLSENYLKRIMKILNELDSTIENVEFMAKPEENMGAFN